jgi:glutamyl-tRNA reductase
MDPTTVVEKAYKLIYLVDVPEAIPEAEIIIADDWKKYMKEILYKIAFMAIKSKAYKTIKDVLIFDSLKLLYNLDNEKPEEDILKNFVKLIYMYVSHSLRNRIDLISNKEKRELIKAKLNELIDIIQWGK